MNVDDSEELEPGDMAAAYVGKDDADLFHEFDRRFVDGTDLTRSQALKRAMRVAIEIDRVLDGVDWSFSGEREYLHWVRQAAIDTIRREEEE